MVNILKIYVDGSQIRRVAVNSYVLGDFKNLQAKIQSILQLDDFDSFFIQWKDSENDLIRISSDEELAQALANADEGLLKLYINTDKDASGKKIQLQQFPHPYVICDGCNNNVIGHRFKCLECHDFDLCSACQSAHKHDGHDMVRLIKPVFIAREWVFPGARKMWKSMFNQRPRHQFFDAMRKAIENEQKDENANSSEDDNATKPKTANYNDNQTAYSSDETNTKPKTPGNKNANPSSGDRDSVPVWPDVFMDFLNGDFVDELKLLTEKFSEFFKHVKGDVEVKLDNPLFKTEMNHQPAKPNEPQPSYKPATKPQCPFFNTSAAEPANPTEEPILPEPSVTNDVSVPVQEAVVAGNQNENMEVDNSAAEAHLNEEHSARAEGWTFIEREVSEASNTEASEERVQYPRLEELQVSCEMQNNVLTCDPVIISAVETMRAMGFTNEGGWLERLLIAKSGNINEVLDSLYPQVKRN